MTKFCFRMCQGWREDQLTVSDSFGSNLAVLFLLVGSTTATLVNLTIMLSIRWIKSPLTPILKASVSLAAADAATSTLYTLSLTLRHYFCEYYQGATEFLIEAIFLSGISIVALHLLVLCSIHYCGILKPFKKLQITGRRVNLLLISAWIYPFVGTLILFNSFYKKSLIKDLLSDRFDPDMFKEFVFRISLTSFFIAIISIMCFCYAHILCILRKRRKEFIGERFKSNQKNYKALNTTLLIMGSILIGWLPSILNYSIMCSKGCLLDGEKLDNFVKNHEDVLFFLNVIEHVLLIVKMQLNPIIYCLRMKEIKKGMKLMHFEVKKKLGCQLSSLSRDESMVL